MSHSESHQALIWKVFGILSVITIVEVAFGITKPDALHKGYILGTSYLNILFLVLTLFKAYYIVWYFMHLGDENKGMKYTIVLPCLLFIPFLAVMLLIEADYVNFMVAPFVNWSY